MSEAKPSEIGWRKDLMEESKESKDSKESDQRVKKYHKLSSDSSGSSDESGDDSSSSSDEKNRKVEKKEKRKEAKLAKKMKKEKRKLEKIQRKEMKKASKKRYKEEKRDMKKLSKIVGKERLQETEADCSVPLDLMCNKALAPETPEEYQAKQKQIRRVVDPETGRTRLIKGDGEILEEIVTKDRHKEINKQATKSDGDFYQKNTVGWNLKKD